MIYEPFMPHTQTLLMEPARLGSSVIYMSFLNYFIYYYLLLIVRRAFSIGIEAVNWYNIKCTVPRIEWQFPVFYVCKQKRFTFPQWLRVTERQQGTVSPYYPFFTIFCQIVFLQTQRHTVDWIVMCEFPQNAGEGRECGYKGVNG